MRYLYLFFAIVLGGLLFAARPVQAAGVTYTVCASGCDFTTLTAALTHPGIFNDTVQMTAGYVFVPGSEATSLHVPNNITVESLPGADVFGDAGAAVRDFSYGSNTIMQNITFENVAFDASGQTNVKWLNNTISGSAESILVLTNTNDAEISGNIGLQNVRLQTADDVVISNNTMHCRYQESCIASSIAGGAPDYHISASISSNVDITNNTIINYTTNSFGDYINLTAGENINITGNTIYSAVVTNDIYLTMVSFSNTEVYFAHNYLIFPEKTAAASNGTWGINLRVGDGDMGIVAEHNTMIMRDGTGSLLSSSSCTGMYDDGSHANPTVTYDFRYNLCYSPSVESGGEGTGVNLTYVLGTINFSFVNSYNGFANYQTLISDSTSTYTALAGTTRTDDPLLRLENASTTDDYYPVPMSRYMDVNGSLDIGAYSAARLTAYTIDDGCTVDYTSCHTNDIQKLNKVLKNGDVVTIGAGMYAPITLSGGLSNVTINGAGATTVFDANDTGSAITINGVSNSSINNIKVQDTSIITTTTYAITRAQFIHGMTAYDQGVNLGIPNAVLVMVSQPSGNTCSSDFWDTDGKDVTTYVGGATQPWNLYLVDYLGTKLTIYAPNNILSDADDILGCANPGEVTVEHFVPSIYTVSGGHFTYNATAAAAAGISVKPGDTNPPALTRTDISTNNAGIMLLSGSGNTFSNVTVSDNSYGVVLSGSVTGNTFDESIFSNNSLYDVRSTSTAVNNIQDSQLNLSKVVATSTGNVRVYYTVHATVQDGNSAAVLSGADVVIKDATNTSVALVTTDITGVTPQSSPLLATIISQGGSQLATAGGKNPFTATGSLSGYSTEVVSFTLDSANPNITIELYEIIPPQGGGGFVDQLTQATTPKVQIISVDPVVAIDAPGVVDVRYEVRNLGVGKLSGVVVEVEQCGALALSSGDINADRVLDVDEVWMYQCRILASESTDIVAIVTGSSLGVSVRAMAHTTVTIALPKGAKPIILLDTKTYTTALADGVSITTSYVLTNGGDTALSQVKISDSKCAPLFGPQGDMNENGMLDIAEAWIYSCRTKVTATAFRVVAAQGSANGLTAYDYASGSLISQVPQGQVIEDGYGYYVVKGGDSLRVIAQQLYGDSDRWPRLVELNSGRYPILVTDPNAIQSGWQLLYDRLSVYSYELISQSPYPSQLAPGETASVWIEVKNTGNVAWFSTGKHPVRLGTGSKYGDVAQQYDHDSEFKHSSWLSANRPATISHAVIEPGWHTRFQFNIKAPAHTGVYRAYFTPVADGVTWMNDIGLYWEITVK